MDNPFNEYAPEAFGYAVDVFPAGETTHMKLFDDWVERFKYVLLVGTQRGLPWNDEQLAGVAAFEVVCPPAHRREKPYRGRGWAPPVSFVSLGDLDQETLYQVIRYLIWPPGKRGLRILPEWFKIKSDLLCLIKEAYVLRSGVVQPPKPGAMLQPGDTTPRARVALHSYRHDANQQAIRTLDWLRHASKGIPEIVYRMITNPARWSEKEDDTVLRALEWMRQQRDAGLEDDMS